MIATKLHQLAGLVGEAEPIVVAMRAAAKFFIAPEIVDIMPRSDVQKSIGAMLQAGIARLPFSPLLVEFAVVPPIHRLVLLDEIGNSGDGGFRARVVTIRQAGFAIVSTSKITVEIRQSGLHVDGHSDESEGRAVGLAASMALLMLNVRGVEKEVVSVERLNLVRQRKGQPLVPQHTVIRIGTIYDRHGQGHKYGGSESGRHMPVHFRCGHARHQHFGEGNAEIRVVYIPPVLVNYREGGEPPRAPEKAVQL